MIHKCANIENCKFCIFISRTFGHPLMHLLRRKWEKIYLHEVITHMRDLNLQIVGGLNYRGWTIHDIDVIGDEKDVPEFVKRLETSGINNPVHFCDKRFTKHSHLLCLIDGLKVILFQNKPFERKLNLENK